MPHLIVKNLLHPAVIILAVVCLSSESSSQIKKAISKPPTSRQENSSLRLSFRDIMSDKGEKDGILISRHVYLASDGVKVLRTGEAHPSLASANERLESQVKDVVKIIQRTPLLVKKRKVGERVVAEFPAAHPDQRRFAVLSTYNKLFWIIEAPTLSHALAFEQFEKERR
jgi:hypothetical protein